MEEHKVEGPASNTKPASTALELEASRQPSTHRTGQHKSVPRWLRMSLRTAILVGLIALPTLAVKEPSFEKLTKYRCGFSAWPARETCLP